jgi:hypothetical protein
MLDAPNKTNLSSNAFVYLAKFGPLAPFSLPLEIYIAFNEF